MSEETESIRKDLHIVELKIRLTERQAMLLEALSQYHDTPRAVIARDFVQQGLETVSRLNNESVAA